MQTNKLTFYNELQKIDLLILINNSKTLDMQDYAQIEFHLRHIALSVRGLSGS
jgi:hypothetical protein